MKLPTNNPVTCDSACHGYLATDYSYRSRLLVTRLNIYAPEKMTITRVVRSSQECGYQIDASAGTRKYRFCHLSRIDVKTGQVVAEGSVIGLIGETGRSYGRHLHLVMWVNDKRVDPDPTIRAIIAKEQESKMTYSQWKADQVKIFGKVVLTEQQWKDKYRTWDRYVFNRQMAITQYKKLVACKKTRDVTIKELADIRTELSDRPTKAELEEYAAEVKRLEAELAKSVAESDQESEAAVDGFINKVVNAIRTWFMGLR